MQPDVLGDAEHALGNLFQRVYHVTRLAREGLGPHADRLTEAVEGIERLIELVFDYVSPVDVELRAVATAKVAESLAAQVRAFARRNVEVGECPAVRVLGDARTLGRIFQLVGRALGVDWERAQRLSLDVVHDEAGGCVRFAVTASPNDVTAFGADTNLALAVAARLIDLHGGELRQEISTESLRSVVTLPIAMDGHDGA